MVKTSHVTLALMVNRIFINHAFFFDIHFLMYGSKPRVHDVLKLT